MLCLPELEKCLITSGPGHSLDASLFMGKDDFTCHYYDHSEVWVYIKTTNSSFYLLE